MIDVDALARRNKALLLTHEGEHLSCYDADILINDAIAALRESEARTEGRRVLLVAQAEDIARLRDIIKDARIYVDTNASPQSYRLQQRIAALKEDG